MGNAAATFHFQSYLQVNELAKLVSPMLALFCLLAYETAVVFVKQVPEMRKHSIVLLCTISTPQESLLLRLLIS